MCSPPVDYEVLGEGVRQAVHGGGPVLAQSVVHVKPVAGDLTQVQLPGEQALVILSHPMHSITVICTCCRTPSLPFEGTWDCEAGYHHYQFK